jgi:hypothetical protein
MTVADLGDAGEILTQYRARTLQASRHASRGQRGWMMLDGVAATLAGLGLPLLVAWLLARKFLVP